MIVIISIDNNNADNDINDTYDNIDCGDNNEYDDNVGGKNSKLLIT